MKVILVIFLICWGGTALTSATARELRCPTRQQIPQASFSVDSRELTFQPSMGLRHVTVMHGDG